MKVLALKKMFQKKKNWTNVNLVLLHEIQQYLAPEPGWSISACL